MQMRTIMLAVVPNDDTSAKAQWRTLDASQPACVTYLRERREVKRLKDCDALPERWRRTCEIFAEHIPEGHHLVRVDTTSLPVESLSGKAEILHRARQLRELLRAFPRTGPDTGVLAALSTYLHQETGEY